MKVHLIFSLSIAFLFACREEEKVDYLETMHACVPDTLRSISQTDSIEVYAYKIDCIIGASLPDFQATTIDGKEINEDYFKGRATVIHFWNKNCSACEAELPGLRELVEQYKSKRVNFLAISINDLSDVKEYLAGHPFPFDHIADGQSIVTNTFKSTWGQPVFIVADKNAKIIHAHSGGSVDPAAPSMIREKLIPLIEKALK